MNFEQIKRNYNMGLWSKPMVQMAVRKGIINREEYQQITGDTYQ